MSDGDLVTLAIDGKEVTVPKGTLLIRAAEQLGIEVPRFCDHPYLEPFYDYGGYTVEVKFTSDGGVDVTYNNGLFRHLEFPPAPPVLPIIVGPAPAAPGPAPAPAPGSPALPPPRKAD